MVPCSVFLPPGWGGYDAPVVVYIHTYLYTYVYTYIPLSYITLPYILYIYILTYHHPRP